MTTGILGSLIYDHWYTGEFRLDQVFRTPKGLYVAIKVQYYT